MDQSKLDFLANSINKARNVMQKVEEGNFHKGSFDSKPILNEEDVDVLLDDNTTYLTEEQVSAFNKHQPRQNSVVPQYMQQSSQPMKNLGKSKMPDAILKSFAENPIVDPSAPIGMDNLMNEIAKKAGNTQKTTTTGKPQAPKSVNYPAPITEQPMGQMDTKLMEYIIRKTVEETLEQVSKRTALSENIQIKIGDKTFSGKITSLNEIKKK